MIFIFQMVVWGLGGGGWAVASPPSELSPAVPAGSRARSAGCVQAHRGSPAPESRQRAARLSRHSPDTARGLLGRTQRRQPL